jgi:prepilin-type N-terminal cleavage/methylation domain-containing protein
MRIPMAPSLGKAGFSLIEALIVVVIMGLLLALVTPRIRDTTLTTEVRNARAAVANLYARARMVAVQQRKTATLRFNGNQVYVTVPVGAVLDTVGAVTDLGSQYGVTLTASGNVTVLPTGLVNAAAPITWKVTKSGKSDSLMITGYGRMQ